MTPSDAREGCGACRKASARTSEAVSRGHFYLRADESMQAKRASPGTVAQAARLR